MSTDEGRRESTGWIDDGIQMLCRTHGEPDCPSCAADAEPSGGGGLVMGDTPATWNESMVREGCMCGHGQYSHAWSFERQQGHCFVFGCSCEAFDRDRRGDRNYVERGGRDG